MFRTSTDREVNEPVPEQIKLQCFRPGMTKQSVLLQDLARVLSFRQKSLRDYTQPSVPQCADTMVQIKFPNEHALIIVPYETNCTNSAFYSFRNAKYTKKCFSFVM